MRGHLTVGSRWWRERDQAVALLYDFGLTSGEIGPRVGCSGKSVRRLLLRQGIPKRIRYGPRSGNWKGGRVKLVSGYIEVVLPPDHPFRCMLNGGNRVLEHRIVMAETIGRPLTRKETVHHVNGDKTDNRPENLQLISGQAHGRFCRAHCGECGSRHIIFGELPSRSI